MGVSVQLAAGWGVCIHVTGDGGPDWHPSLVEWLRRNGDRRVLCVVDEEHGQAFGASWPAGAGCPAPLTRVAPAGSGMASALAMARRELGDGDLAYIHAGCEVTNDWDVLLARALCEDPGIGVVSPLSAASPILSPFPGSKPDWMQVGHIHRWLAHLSHGKVLEVPGIAPFCSFWRAAALAVLQDDGIMGIDGLEDELARLGRACVVCDWVYVEAPAGAATSVVREREGMQSFLTYHPLGRIRHAFGEAGAWGEPSVPAAAPMIKPVQLHVAHSWGGGLGRWVEDMCEADEGRWNLVLRSIGTWGAFGQRIALYRSHEMDKPLRDWLLDKPIGSIAVGHVQYRRLLREIVRDFHVDAVIVSSLVGHSLDVLDLPLPCLIVAHDYTPFCPALSIRFDGVCTGCNADRLRDCFAHNPLNHFFREAGSDYWLALREHYFRRVRGPQVRVVAPSASVVRHLHELAPSIADLPIDVIEHGIDFPPGPTWEPSRDGRLRLVVLGSMAPQKGADLLAAALPALSGFADVYLVGCGDEGERFGDLGAGRIVRRYRREDLPGIIAGIAPHVGLLLSVVPETFSYTLSELWAMRVPPVATRLGGFVDRIEDGSSGFLIEPDADELVALLRGLDIDRTRLDTVRTELSSRPVRTREDMVADYHRALPLPAIAPGIPAGLPGRPAAQHVQVEPGERIGALHVDRQVPLRTVLNDFSIYLRQKIQSTPRLNPWRKRLLLTVLGALRRALR